MLKTPLQATWPLIALTMVASGCGETAGTHKTASAPANTAAPATTSAPAATSTARSPKVTAPSVPGAHQQPTTTQSQERTNEIHIPKKQLEQARREQRIHPYKFLEAAGVPLKKRFPTVFQNTFIRQCTANGGSSSGCKCILAAFEEVKGNPGQPIEEVKEQSIAELVYTETALKRGIPVPKRIKQRMHACHITVI